MPVGAVGEEKEEVLLNALNMGGERKTKVTDRERGVKLYEDKSRRREKGGSGIVYPEEGAIVSRSLRLKGKFSLTKKKREG